MKKGAKRKRPKLHIVVEVAFVMAEGRFEQLEAFAKHAEKSLAAEARRWIETKVEKLGQTPTDSSKIELAENWEQLEKVYPQILRAGIFMQCAADFEHLLFRLTRTIQRRRTPKLTLNDLNGGGIERSQKYLKKVANLPFPDETQEWRDILDLSQLRNIVVHNDRRIAPENKAGDQIRKFVRQWSPDLVIEHGDRVDFSARFVARVIRLYAGFYTMLRTSLRASKLYPTTRGRAA